MSIWEICILMIVATICVAAGIGFVYSSIVNTVERYQIRRTKRELEMATKIIEEIPGAITKIVDIVTEKEKERDRKKNEEFIEKNFEDYLNKYKDV